MNCFFCDQSPIASCKFCGKFICMSHMQNKEFYTGFKGVYPFSWETALSVVDASWCGNCKVEYWIVS